MSVEAIFGTRHVYTGELDNVAYVKEAPILDIKEAGTRGGLDLVTLTLDTPNGVRRVTVYDCAYRTINGDGARPATPKPVFDPLGINARLKLCTAFSPSAPPPLTLGQRQEIRGRALVAHEDGTPYCTLCLEDIPTDPAEMFAHVCPDERPEPEPEAPAPVVHKTRTHEQSAIVEPGGYGWNGLKIRYDVTVARAVCTCGWKKWANDREEARAWARGHRANPDA